ncbi:MAG: ZIP family metal transporter [Planifilum sp.]|jgi:zinc transporter ZupT
MAVWGWVAVAALGYVLGGCVIWWKRQWSERGLQALLAVSTGVLLGVAILGMLPHGLAESPDGIAWVLAGLLAAYGLQRWLRLRKSEPAPSHSAMWGALSGMGIHAFFEGVALGVGFHTDARLGFAVLAALVLHKIPEGVAIASLAIADGKRKSAMTAVALLAISTALGTGAALAVTEFSAAGIPLLFSAGILLYIAGTELWPAVNRGRGWSSMGWLLSGVLLYGLMGWGSHLLDPTHAHSHEHHAAPPAAGAAGHHHHAPVEVAEGSPVPAVELIVTPDEAGGWNIHVATSRFRFAPERVNQGHRPGEGHAHLYVNGRKIARLYASWFHLDSLPPGTHTLRVELNSNDHRPLMHQGQIIEDTVTLTVP